MILEEVTKDTFNDVVLNSDVPVLVDFNALWCGPCMMQRPILEDLAVLTKGIKVVSVNIDDEEELAREYGVMSIPCLVLFNNGKEVNRHVGLMDKDELDKFIGE
jgi:thioredoxin 1